MTGTEPMRAPTVRLLRRFWRRCSGQVVAITAVIIPALLVVGGLALDGGMVYQVKRRMQTAADAAAMGGALELYRGKPEGVVAAAREDAKLNGFEDGVNATVTVNRPPSSGTQAGNSQYVEVIVSRNVPTTLMRVINRDLTLVVSRAVAGITNLADGCVVSLDPTARGALTVAGGASLTAGCGVIVDSSDAYALNLNGGGCVTALQIGVTGGVDGTCLTPAPTLGIPATLDPLLAMQPPPVPASVTANNFKMTGGTATLNPGLYQGGIDISGGNVTFSPGTYVLTGGDLSITGNTVAIGNGVTFYITSDQGNGNPQYGTFKIAGTAKVDFHAPDSGAYEGMLFWQDRNAPDKPTLYADIEGTSDSVFEGTIYLANNEMKYAGTNTATNWTNLIGKRINIVGNAVVNGNYDQSTIQVPSRKAALVE